MEKRVSFWKAKNGRDFKVVSVRSEEKTMFKITGWNPLPIMGYFESSYKVLKNWLIDNGCYRTVSESLYVERF